ncbi:MAG: ParA family protein [Candidatus Methanoperedens sp.]|nr:ParA family protein [Candidatus Methanoperedens sp.]
MTKRISIINFKGGVGKTTIALHLATGLARYHDSKVLLVDVDHQSSLSITILRKEWEAVDIAGKTINSIFLHFTDSSREIPMPGKEIIYNKPFSTRPFRKTTLYDRLDLVPSTLKLDETELDLTSTAIGTTDESEWNKRGQICRWLEKNDIDSQYDYIIFDCPPATQIITQNAIAASHGYIIPVIPEYMSTRGIPHLKHLLSKRIDKRMNEWVDGIKGKGKKVASTYIPNTQLVGIVISMIQKSGRAYSGYIDEHTEILNEIITNWGEFVVKPYIENGTGVSQSLQQGLPVYSSSDNPNVTNRDFIEMFKELTGNLKKKIDAI